MAIRSISSPAVAAVAPKTTTPRPAPAPVAAPRTSSRFDMPAAKPVALTTPAGPSAAAKRVDPSKVPVINQNSATGYRAVPGYDGKRYCGPTVALMVGEFFGAKATPANGSDAARIKSLWDKYGVAGDNGTTPTELGKMLDAQGLRFHPDDKGAISQPGLVSGPGGGYVVNAAYIDRELAAGRPVVAQGEMVPGEGHWITIVGVNRDTAGNITSYEVRNPWDGDTRMSPDEVRTFLANADGGHLYSVEPKP